MTYNRQGTNKKGVNPATHTIIYSGNTPVVLPGENLTRKPIRIIPFTPRDKLETTSRLDYAKVYTIEFNVKVCFIGVIHDDSKDQLLKGFAEVQSLQVPCEPLSNSQPPSQPVRKVLDPGKSIKFKILQAMLTVILQLTRWLVGIFLRKAECFQPLIQRLQDLPPQTAMRSP